MMCTLFVPVSVARAANNKIIELKENRTYSYDLNGDKKKEKIIFKCKPASDYSEGKIQIYINGKKLFSRKLHTIGAYCYLVDLNTKDNNKELLIQAFSESDCTAEFLAFRYKSKNKTTILEGCDKPGYLNCNARQLCLYRFSVSSNTGSNKLYISADTPYSNSCFGSYYIKVPVAIKNGKIIAQKQSSYKVLDYTKTFVYQLNRSMKLYEKASTDSKSTICDSGSKFNVMQLKPVKKNKDRGALYVKVKMSSGMTGWLYFPDESNGSEYLKDIPSWG